MHRAAATVITAGLASTALGVLTLIPAASMVPGTDGGVAVQLTAAGADASMDGVVAEMADANKTIDDLATQNIWGQDFAEWQQHYQDGLTGSITQIAGLQEAVTSASSVVDANEGLDTALTHLVSAEQALPVVSAADQTDPLANLEQLPTLVFDQLKVLDIDYTQVMPAGLEDIFASAGAELGTVFDGL